MRVMLLVTLAACTSSSPGPGSLTPRVQIEVDPSDVRVIVVCDGNPDVSIKAMFRGSTSTVTSDGDGTYTKVIAIDHAVGADEPLEVEIAGVSMKMTAPPPFADVQVPQSISRSQNATVTWTPTSADPILWYVASGICAQSMGGAIPPSASSFTFTAADWQPGTDSCPVDVRFVRHRDTGVDPAFAGGSLTFHQSYDLMFTSTP